nr:F-box associated interaction domain, leucine-rich repeat domain, L domain-like protein [Tanacetum cinerariifolium]
MNLSSRMLSNDPLITSGGSVYCLMSNCNIFKFDAYSEKWSTVRSPYPVYNTHAYTSKKLLKYEGKLGLACMKNNGFWDIWIHTIDKSWERTYILNKTDYIGGMSLESFYGSDTSVMLDHDSLIFHRFKGCDNIDKANDTSKKVTLSNPPYEKFNIQSDHQQVNLKGTKAEDSSSSDTLAAKSGVVLMACLTCGKKGDHWTSRCPYYNDLPQPTQASEKFPDARIYEAIEAW